jgi:hypothetical protein
MGWIGVDFDGVLAEQNGPSRGLLGRPVEKMVEKVRAKIAEGIEIRIVTARVASIEPDRENQRKLITAWGVNQLGAVLPVTAEKDRDMLELWDNLARQVVTNLGEFLFVRGL